jgi:hypothetical protein
MRNQRLNLLEEKRCGQKKEKKRKRRLLPKKLPGWLTYDEGQKKIKTIESREIVVKRIFDLYCKSIGMERIARTLNEESVPVFGKGKMWHRSYIGKILENIAAYGSYQPYSLRGGHRYKAGEVLKNYFPAVVTKDIFDKANANIALRKDRGRGRKGKTVTNLFSGMIYCFVCGSKLHIVNKGKGVKGGRYLYCIKSKAKAGCESIALRLDKIEEKILDHLHEIDYSEVFGDEDSRLNPLNTTRLNTQGEIKRLELLEGNLLSMLSQGKLDERSIENISNQYNNLLRDRENASKELRETELSIKDIVSSKNAMLSSEIKKIIGEVKSSGASYELRATVQSMLLKVVEKIIINNSNISYYPWEYSDSSIEVINFKKIHPSYNKIKINDLCKLKSFRLFATDYEREIRIHFKNGESRNIYIGHDISFLHSPIALEKFRQNKKKHKD